LLFVSRSTRALLFRPTAFAFCFIMCSTARASSGKRRTSSSGKLPDCIRSSILVISLATIRARRIVMSRNSA
jgi:hypothetical protein